MRVVWARGRIPRARRYVSSVRNGRSGKGGDRCKACLLPASRVSRVCEWHVVGQENAQTTLGRVLLDGRARCALQLLARLADAHPFVRWSQRSPGRGPMHSGAPDLVARGVRPRFFSFFCGRVARPAAGSLCRIDEKFEHRLGGGPQQCVPSRNFQVPNLLGDHRGDCGHFTYGDVRYTGHCSRERARSRAS